ncbi:MAG TPA: hypothetical protein VHM65_04185, partial [Candidatus Lustribacter sp.]|nr:hypothetical protein [Candidatus Lustribacter sp.]
ATRWVQVRVPGATHQAKHTRGLVAREICRAGADPRSVPEPGAVLSERFMVTLTGPARPGRPWVLEAVARSPRAGAAVS